MGASHETARRSCQSLLQAFRNGYGGGMVELEAPRPGAICELRSRLVRTGPRNVWKRLAGLPARRFVQERLGDRARAAGRLRRERPTEGLRRHGNRVLPAAGLRCRLPASSRLAPPPRFRSLRIPEPALTQPPRAPRHFS